MKYFLNRSYNEINISVRGKSQIYVMLVRLKKIINSLTDMHSISRFLLSIVHMVFFFSEKQILLT